ncbi:MAG: glycosyltransferase, partial [Armatimonadota bacterium]
TYNILKYLGSRHEISLLTFLRSEDEISLLQHLKPFCHEIDFCLIKRSALINLQGAVKSLLSEQPFMILRDLHPEMRFKVNEAVKRKPDLLYVDHLQMFQYVPRPRLCPVVLDNHNVEWRIIERFAYTDVPLPMRAFACVEWRRLRTYEINACLEADLVFTVTDKDRNILISNGVDEHKIVSLPIGVHAEDIELVQLGTSDKKVTTFGTMSWPPNADSVLYFARLIHPLVIRRKPDSKLLIIGKNPPRSIKALSKKDGTIEVYGYVEDLRSAVQGTAAFVVPLRIGSGMRVKILDAMAMGLPVVTTSVGCEGIELEPGKHALVVDDPVEFAEAVVYLLDCYEARMCLATAGRSLVEQYYSWRPILERLEQALTSIQC